MPFDQVVRLQDKIFTAEDNHLHHHHNESSSTLTTSSVNTSASSSVTMTHQDNLQNSNPNQDLSGPSQGVEDNFNSVSKPNGEDDDNDDNRRRRRLQDEKNQDQLLHASCIHQSSNEVSPVQSATPDMPTTARSNIPLHHLHQQNVHDHHIQAQPMVKRPVGSTSSYLQNIPGINMTLSANDPSVQRIKQHYYPEGGWGWVILLSASVIHFFSAGLTPACGLLTIEIINRFNPDQGVVAAVLVGAFSTCVTLSSSPLITSICRRKSPRLLAVIGGLVTALGCLFSSFATQFHQLFFSYGLFVGIGVSLIRDPAVIMIGQYFKKKREAVEVILLSCYSLGIAFMPLFVTSCIRSKSWRFGLQIMACVMSLSFILGILYRPASLYHPQRRAILHLKSLQKRSRLKDQHLKNLTGHTSGHTNQQNVTQSSLGGDHGVSSTVHQQKEARPPSSLGGLESSFGGHSKNNPRSSSRASSSKYEKESYFDFSILKSRTVQIILSGTCISHFGMTAPLLLLAIQGQNDGLDYASLMRLQIFFGLGMMVGVLLFGFIIIKNSHQCLISRQYLVQASGIILSFLTFAFASGLHDYSGYVLFSSICGFFYGGYMYAIKMFIFEKVRARNFNTSWGYLQFVQSLPLFFGIPITIFLNEHFESKSGFFLSSTCLALGSGVFFLIDAHKSSKRKNRQLRHETNDSRKVVDGIGGSFGHHHNKSRSRTSCGTDVSLGTFGSSKRILMTHSGHHHQHHRHHNHQSGDGKAAIPDPRLEEDADSCHHMLHVDIEQVIGHDIDRLNDVNAQFIPSSGGRGRNNINNHSHEPLVLTNSASTTTTSFPSSSTGFGQKQATKTFKSYWRSISSALSMSDGDGSSNVDGGPSSLSMQERTTVECKDRLRNDGNVLHLSDTNVIDEKENNDQPDSPSERVTTLMSKTNSSSLRLKKKSKKKGTKERVRTRRHSGQSIERGSSCESTSTSSSCSSSSSDSSSQCSSASEEEEAEGRNLPDGDVEGDQMNKKSSKKGKKRSKNKKVDVISVTGDALGISPRDASTPDVEDAYKSGGSSLRSHLHHPLHHLLLNPLQNHHHHQLHSTSSSSHHQHPHLHHLHLTPLELSCISEETGIMDNFMDDFVIWDRDVLAETELVVNGSKQRTKSPQEPPTKQSGKDVNHPLETASTSTSRNAPKRAVVMNGSGGEDSNSLQSVSTSESERGLEVVVDSK